MPPTIVIAGASGFVGKALVKELHGSFPIVALSRSPRPNTPNVEWRSCDLFSLADTEQALQGADIGVYLVHSMLPSSHLFQGNFMDTDLIIADNFARAASKANLKRIVYLGGLVPPDAKLSKHLASRLEVEKTLAAYGTPTTALRASMVIGPGGSSFDILTQLVRRLPVMIAPQWTLSKTQPIALNDVVSIITRCIEEDIPGPLDVGGPDVLTYRAMLDTVGEILEKRRPILSVSLLTPRLSKLWVRTVTGAPKQLVSPLIDSLRHDMVVGEHRMPGLVALAPTKFTDAVRQAVAAEEVSKSASWSKPKRERDVRSVQRLPLPKGKDGRWVADEYLRWLPKYFRHLMRVRVDATGDAKFYLTGLRKPILDLQYAEHESTPECALFFIIGGHLVRSQKEAGPRARLEFRVVNHGAAVIAAIHDFRPALPWYIYRWTQALFHAAVMKLFGRHLRRKYQT